MLLQDGGRHQRNEVQRFRFRPFQLDNDDQQVGPCEHGTEIGIKLVK
jgi:hypothetical protein